MPADCQLSRAARQIWRRWAPACISWHREDPSFHFTRDEESNQTVIEGMGELHLDIIVDRLSARVLG